MAKGKMEGNPKGEINRHKAMAMGEKIELAKGGLIKKKKDEKKYKKK